MAMYSFVPHFLEAKFCGVPSCVFDKLGCAADEKMLRNTGLEYKSATPTEMSLANKCFSKRQRCNKKKIEQWVKKKEAYGRTEGTRKENLMM
jgi:hypothetical protein